MEVKNKNKKKNRKLLASPRMLVFSHDVTQLANELNLILEISERISAFHGYPYPSNFNF